MTDTHGIPTHVDAQDTLLGFPVADDDAIAFECREVELTVNRARKQRLARERLAP